MRLWNFWIGLLSIGVMIAASPATDQARIPVADAFDQPVGKPDGQGYYMSRGFLQYHLGEDWNGVGGGNTDLGDPVYSIGIGYVTLARDVRMGWGNVVLIRHAFVENAQIQIIDSLYGHLDKILVHEGQIVSRGQQVGTIGTNHGMYEAHLHFEIHKNLHIGINHSAFPRNFSNYFRPGTFIAQHRKISGSGTSAIIPLNTYGFTPPSFSSSPSSRSWTSSRSEMTPAPTQQDPSPKKRFRVNRFELEGF